MVTGRVIRFDEIKGYGFITPSDGGEDVFVHTNDFIDRGQRVGVGSQVEFQVIESDRGLKAYDVRVVGDQRPAHTAHPADDAPQHNVGYAAQEAPKEPSAADAELFEVFPEIEFAREITDLLLTAAPQLTGATILELRGHLVQFARKNGWVE